MSTDEYIVPPTRGANIARQIFESYVKNEEPERAHLGGSAIGADCARSVWLGWRWAVERIYGKRHPDDPVREKGRMLRLFKRGHREEPVFIGDLRAIGLDIHEFNPRTGKQWRYKDLAGHFGSSLDGKVYGLQSIPKAQAALLECKTYALQYFNELITADTVKVGMPKHYAQMQVYMHLAGLRWALYIAVCKDNDDLYTEIVEYDQTHAERMMMRAQNIVGSPEPPERISQDPTNWKCKMCDKWRQCQGKEMPLVNCRTCAFATPVTDRGDNGIWRCEKWGADIPLDAQRQGCPSHVFIPALIENHYEHVGGEEGQYTELRHRNTGVVVRNGTPSAGVLASTELRVVDPEQLDRGVYDVRQMFNARFVEHGDQGVAVTAEDFDEMERVKNYWDTPKKERMQATAARPWK